MGRCSTPPWAGSALGGQPSGTVLELASAGPKLTVLPPFFLFQIEKIMSSIGEGIDFSQEQQKISGSRTLEQSVGEWLESIGLQQYESKLLLNGFDDVRFLVSAADVLAQAEVGKSTESFTLGESQPRGCGHPEVRWVAEANFADRPGPATCGPSATQREHTWDPDSHPGPSLVS